jgi:hypothetical protein
MMQRVVTAELLDGLDANDPDAMRSRMDLQRVHRAMGTRAILLSGLKALAAKHPKDRPLRLLEIGAGDGSLMLGVAQALTPTWSRVDLTLLDRQHLLDKTTVDRYAAVGWTAVAQVVDVLDWAAASVSGTWDLVVANLFLHHFQGVQLDAILAAIALRTSRFFACEPRRDWLALAGSHLIGAIGAGAVTREDAVSSVCAGFNGNEITALWPHGDGQWQVQEYSAGLFSHCFRAERPDLRP